MLSSDRLAQGNCLILSLAQENIDKSPDDDRTPDLDKRKKGLLRKRDQARNLGPENRLDCSDDKDEQNIWLD